MNGAESLVRTLVAGKVDVCFTNPGTSEMHFVSALDRVDGMRCVLGLFEGVVTGAADGYARMAEKPAATILHLGPGFANGVANLHNAMKAAAPIVNIVGDHATYHRHLDAPLTSDIEGMARPLSAWIKTAMEAASVGAAGAEACEQAGQQRLRRRVDVDACRLGAKRHCDGGLIHPEAECPGALPLLLRHGGDLMGRKLDPGACGAAARARRHGLMLDRPAG